MADDVLLNKAASIERCVARAREEYQVDMVGFRNIAVHEYQELQLPITVDIIEHRLDDFLAFSKAVLLRER